MDFLTLTGSKSSPGSLLNYVNYKRIPVEVVLQEAQALIYSTLRVREMRAASVLTLQEQAWTIALPSGYLDPIVMRDREGWEVLPQRYIEETTLLAKRTHDTDVVTTLNGTITAGATSLIVADRGEFPTTFPFTVQIDSEVVLVTAGAGTTWTVTRGYGGTTAAAHTSGATVDGMLNSGTPTHVAVFDEMFQFDCKAEEARTLDLVFFKTPAALSASNKTNFLTVRYPTLVRVACLAEAARFMKDSDEFLARKAELIGLCGEANAESDQGRAA